MSISVICSDRDIAALIRRNFSAFGVETQTEAELAYLIGRDDQGLYLHRGARDGDHSWSQLTSGECLFLLEKDLTIELQKLRGQLYFLHAAALRYQDAGLLLVGRSGGGKSTTCWGLLHHGCEYLSDELAPIDLDSLQIQPYPHALCMKSEPPAPYPTPPATLRTEATLHIPTTDMPTRIVTRPTTVATLVFVEHVSPQHSPEVIPIGTAEASALLYGQALNPLSHAHDGLDGAVTIARQCRCLRLHTGELSTSIELLLKTLEHPAQL